MPSLFPLLLFPLLLLLPLLLILKLLVTLLVTLVSLLFDPTELSTSLGPVELTGLLSTDGPDASSEPDAASASGVGVGVEINIPEEDEVLFTEAKSKLGFGESCL